MGTAALLGAIVGGTVLAGTAAAFGGATTLFRRVIPRQDSIKVDISEMADMQK